MIDRVAKAQALADDARIKALKDYMDLLNGVKKNEFGDLKLGAEGDYLRLGPLGGLGAGVIGGVNPGLTTMPTLTDPFSSYGFNPTMPSPNQSVEVTINTGVGDPEAIARAVEDLLNQSTYRGTSVNRGAGNYIL
jgi:hypothetical protein